MTTTATRQLPPGPRPRRVAGLFTRRRVVSSLALAIATGLLLLGLWDSKDGGIQVTGSRPAPILDVFPPEGAAALRQEPIGVQLADGFTGEIEVDGRPIPLDQTERPLDPAPGSDAAPVQRGLAGLNRISFTPGQGKEIARLEPGSHTARVLYWARIGGTREQAQVYSWSFTAA